MTPMKRFLSSIETGSTRDDDPFAFLNNLVEETIGVRLFSVTAFDESQTLASRIYTNMPKEYPVQGTKQMVENVWTECVLENHRTYVANDIDTIATVFPDYELIKSLGCESVVNIPLLVDGRVRATLNCLHEAGHYNEERVALCETLKLPGLLCFLMWENRAR